MCKRAFITLILVALTIGGPIASAQDWQEKEKAKEAPKAAAKQEQKEKEKARTPRPSPPVIHPPSAQGPDKPIEPLTMKVERGVKIGVTSKAVNVIVTGWDRDTLHATARSENGPQPVEADKENGKINVYVPAGRVRRPSNQVTLEIKVPRYADLETIESNRGSIQVTDTEASVLISSGTGDVAVTKVGALKLGTRGGNVSIKDVKSNLVVRNARGNLTIEGVGGKVDTESTHGNVMIRNVGGDVRANSWLGNLDVHCAKGRADLTSVNGAITIVGVGGDVEAQSTNGEINFTGAIRSEGSYKLKSLSAEVEMLIQSDAPGFSVSLTSYNGNIETAFPIRKETSIEKGPINRFIKGTYKGGGAQIVLDSFNGGIRLLKAASGALKECK